MTTQARRFFKLCCVFMASSFLIAAVPPPVQADKLEEGRAAIGEGDYARAVELLAPLADSGDAVAQNAMGVLFVQGWGVDRDPKRAVSYFQRSAKQANAKGAMNLADAYRTGTGVKPSCVKARDLLAQHAQNGNAKAQVSMGAIYDKGCKDLSPDPKEAFRWYSAAAEQDDPYGLGNAAAMYALGLGVDQNYDEAMKYYSKAAELGNGKAAYNLGRMYEFGEGMPPDPALAKHWYKVAVSLGEVEAERRLAALDTSGKAGGAIDTGLMAEALKAPAIELAQSYGSVSSILEMLPLVEAGVTLQTPNGQVNRNNVVTVRDEFKQRLAIYEQAIKQRGAVDLSGEYVAKAKKCGKSGSAWAMLIAKGYDRIFVEQNGSEVEFEASRKRRRNAQDFTAAGFCVENSIALFDPMNSDYVLVGEAHNGQITIRPHVESILQAWPDWIQPPSRSNLSSCIVTLNPDQ